MKAGLLGAGRIGSLHASILAEHPSVDGMVVFDPDGDRARALAATHDADLAGSVDEVLDGCDAVVIASSTSAHTDDLVAAADAGVPAFCEKPVATELADADRAIAAVERAGIPVQVGFNRRSDAGFRAARRAVARGELGDLMLVVGHHHDHRPPPDEYIPISGGQYKDQLIHDFDLLRFVTGDEVVRVRVAATPFGLDAFARNDDQAVSAVTLWLRGGAMAVLVGVRLDPVGYDVRMELFGTGDSIAVGLDDRTPLRSVEPGQQPPQDPYTEWLPRFGAAFEAQMDAFLKLARSGGDPVCSVYDGRTALAIAEACRRSAATGEDVALEDVDG